MSERDRLYCSVECGGRKRRTDVRDGSIVEWRSGLFFCLVNYYYDINNKKTYALDLIFKLSDKDNEEKKEVKIFFLNLCENDESEVIGEV
jgi:hypothetical protein